MRKKVRRKTILPGFGLTLGITVTYLGLVVLIPLSMLFIKTAGMGFQPFIEIVTSPRSVSAYWLSFYTAAISALINAVFGFLVAWVMVRYSFFGKKVLNALIDIPFALPTAVAGIALTAAYSGQGWIGHLLGKIGITAVFNPIGIIIALTFIGMPFVIRTIEPVLEDMEKEMEEAASSLGASRIQTWIRVILPTVLPAWITGTTLSFARSLGEYGSVVFISGNMPFKTEIAPLLIMTQLEQYNYEGATAIACIMLLASFSLLLLINSLQAWSKVRGRG